MVRLRPSAPTETNGAVALGAAGRLSGTDCPPLPGSAIVMLVKALVNVLTWIVPVPDADTEPVPTSATVPVALSA